MCVSVYVYAYNVFAQHYFESDVNVLHVCVRVCKHVCVHTFVVSMRMCEYIPEFSRSM
jgi:hypothetical protein